MPEPFLAEVRLFAGTFAPVGWALCNGQLLSISQNTALFSLLGTTYGGNGQTTFALPDFRGRIGVGAGGGFTQGQVGGETTHTLTLGEMAAHSHAPAASTAAANTTSLANNYWGAVGAAPYHPTANTPMNAAAIPTNTGGGQPH